LALSSANGIRRNRRDLKDRLRQLGAPGADALATVLSQPPAWLASVYVWQLVLWVPRVGDSKAAAMLKASGIDPWRKVGKLTERQRTALALELRRHAASPGMPYVCRPPRGPSSRRCSGCGVYLRTPNAEMLCGFCVEERQAA
jgi:hypothetical protein